MFVNKKIWLGVYWYPLKNRGYFVTWGGTLICFFQYYLTILFWFSFSGGHKYKKKFIVWVPQKYWFFLSVFSPFHWNRYWICRQKLKNTHIFLINKYRVSHAWIKIISIMTENLDHSIIILFWFHPFWNQIMVSLTAQACLIFTFPKLLKLVYLNSLSKHVFHQFKIEN